MPTAMPLVPNAHIDGHTRLVALLGWPVEHSFSPAMQNAAFQEAGLNFCYLALPVAPGDLGAAVAGLRAVGAAGWNVTIPHKQEVIALLDEVSQAALAIGAVNTVRNVGGRLVGHNTDVAGFMAGLYAAAGEATNIGSAVVLGAGGSARAVVWGLASAGTRVTIMARREEQARSLADELGQHLPGRIGTAALDAKTLNDALASADVLVNCTPAGMWPHSDESPLPPGVELPGHLLVYDLIYNPRQTPLLTRAAASGCRTQNGIAMLVNQGAEAFRIWTGHDPDRAIMEQALTELLGG